MIGVKGAAIGGVPEEHRKILTGYAEVELSPPAVNLKDGFHFYATDHLNSTRRLDDWEPSVSDMAIDYYYPYGEINTLMGSGGEDTDYKFTGYEQNSGIGLYYARARYYNPAIGRFLTPDPAGQFWSPYSYTGGMPHMLVDPDGELAWFAPILIGAALGGLSYTTSVAFTDREFEPWDFAASIGIGALAGSANIGLNSISNKFLYNITKGAVANTLSGLSDGVPLKDIWKNTLTGAAAGFTLSGVYKLNDFVGNNRTLTHLAKSTIYNASRNIASGKNVFSDIESGFDIHKLGYNAFADAVSITSPYWADKLHSIKGLKINRIDLSFGVSDFGISFNKAGEMLKGGSGLNLFRVLASGDLKRTINMFGKEITPSFKFNNIPLGAGLTKKGLITGLTKDFVGFGMADIFYYY